MVERMVDTRSLLDIGQRQFPVEHVGLVIGTCGATPYVHLQLAVARKHFGDDFPILVVNDGEEQDFEPRYIEGLKAICNNLKADFRPGPRLGHMFGDLRVFSEGLEWAEEKNVQLLVKLSRRYIPLVSWRHGLLCLAGANQHASAFSRFHDDNPKGLFRTDCIALRVQKWHAMNFRESIREIMDNTPEHFQVEPFIYANAKSLGGWETWDLIGPNFYTAFPNALQWRGIDPAVYADLARSLSLKGLNGEPYRDADFEPNAEHFTAFGADGTTRSTMTAVPMSEVRFRELAVDEDGNPVGPSTPKEPDTTKPLLFTQADDAFAEGAVKLLRTVKEHADGVFMAHVCLCDHTLSSVEWARLHSAGWTMQSVSVPDLQVGSVPQRSALFRTRVAEVASLLYPDAKHALFLDADTMLVDSIDEIKRWPEMLGNDLVAACLHEDRKDWYNIGVLYINLKRWADEEIGRKLLENLEKMKGAGIAKPDTGIPYDEHILSALFSSAGVTTLAKRWNITPGEVGQEAFSHKIVHFRGPKPWHDEYDKKFEFLLGGDFEKYKRLWREV